MAPAAKHRESLISASANLFQLQGYAATGLAEILAESGAPRGSLYHYFPDGKEAIAEAAVREAGAEMEKSIRSGAALIGDPARVALAFGENLARSMAASEFGKGCKIATVALEAAPHSARLTSACRDAFDSWSRALTDMLVRAGATAERGAQLADFILAGFQGAMILARVRQSTAPLLNQAAEIARVLNHEFESKRNAS